MEYDDKDLGENPYEDLGFHGIDREAGRRIREYNREGLPGERSSREKFISSYEFLKLSEVKPEERIHFKKGLLNSLGIASKNMDAKTISNRLNEIYSSAINGNWEY